MESLIDKINSGFSRVMSVRRVQRGTTTISNTTTSTTTAGNITVPLTGFTNTSKMLVILDGYASASAPQYYAYYALPIVTSLSTTNLIITYSGYYSENSLRSIAYQVIEFY